MERIDGNTEEMRKLKELFPEIMLVSSSPNRRALLTDGGIAVRVFVPGSDESTDDLTAGEAVERNAVRKLNSYLSSSAFSPGTPSLSSDTLVEIDSRLLGKPVDYTDAYKTLSLLSGRKQSVYTGCALYNPETGRTISFYDRADVTFRKLSEDEIKDYLSRGEWKGAAGGYRLQKTGYELVESIDGDPATVVGLPIRRIVSLLAE